MTKHFDRQGAKEHQMKASVQRCSEGTLPTCCEEHSVRFALLLRSAYAADYSRFLLENEPPSGWRDEQQSALAFAQEKAIPVDRRLADRRQAGSDRRYTELLTKFGGTQR